MAIRLMKHDYSFPVSECTPTTIVSFYNLNEGDDPEEAVTFITNRFTEILKKNPWLCGRLVRYKHEGETNVFLSYEEEIPSIDNYFKVLDDDKLLEMTEWKDVFDHLWPMKPKKGRECIDKDEKLCQLLVFQNTEQSKLALMWSLNHSIGDGSTCYQLWKMLDKNESAMSMIAERYHDMHEAVERQTNLQRLSASAAEDIKMVVSMLGRGLKRKICRNTPPNDFMYKVNADEIIKLKSKYNSGDSFVSTNDILCTEIFASSDPNQGLQMVVNARDRILELRKNMAGNYITYCPIALTEIKTPKDFRERWTSILRKEVPADVVNKAGHATANWLTLYHQVEVPGFSHRIHMPVFSPCDFVERMVGIPVSMHCGIIPFHLSNEEVGLAMSVHNDVITEEYLEKCEVLGDKVTLWL